MGNHSLTEYPLLGDGAWREAFPPAWLDEGEETARTGKFVVRDVLINQAGAVSFSAIIPSGDELSITIDLDELSLVQVVPSSSTVAEPDYRDVIAALRHAEIQVAPESPPIQSAESELSVENEPLSEPTSGNTRLPQTSPAKKKTAPIATNAAAAPALTQWLSDLPEMDADETLQLTYHLQPGPNTRAAHPVYGVVVHERDSDGGFLPFSLQHLPQDGSISHADTNILLRLSAIAHEFPAAPVLPLRGQVGALLLHEILQTERCFIHGAPDEDDPAPWQIRSRAERRGSQTMRDSSAPGLPPSIGTPKSPASSQLPRPITWPQTCSLADASTLTFPPVSPTNGWRLPKSMSTRSQPPAAQWRR